MMELKVTVVLPGLPEAINNLANVLMNQAQTIKMTAQQTVIPAAPNSEPVQPVPAPVAEPAVEATPAPVVEPTVEAAPAPVAAPAVEEAAAIPPTPAVDPTPTKKYTREEIANAGSALVTQGKMNDLLALLQKYGVQSITQLDPNQYNVFAADLKALGAAL